MLTLVIALATIVVMLIIVVVVQQRQVLEAVAKMGLSAASEAYQRGLYEGEKARREAAERHQTWGSPIAPKAVELAPAKPSEEIARDVGKPFSEETVLRGIEHLRQEYSAIGRILTDQELRDEVETMLMVDPNMIEG